MKSSPVKKSPEKNTAKPANLRSLDFVVSEKLLLKTCSPSQTQNKSVSEQPDLLVSATPCTSRHVKSSNLISHSVFAPSNATKHAGFPISVRSDCHQTFCQTKTSAHKKTRALFLAHFHMFVCSAVHWPRNRVQNMLWNIHFNIKDMQRRRTNGKSIRYEDLLFFVRFFYFILSLFRHSLDEKFTLTCLIVISNTHQKTFISPFFGYLLSIVTGQPQPYIAAAATRLQQTHQSYCLGPVRHIKLRVWRVFIVWTSHTSDILAAMDRTCRFLA